MPLIGAANAWITPSVATSVLALLFTVASFWLIQVRRGRLRIDTGHTLSGALLSDKSIIYLPLVFQNPAPAALVVADLRLVLEQLPSSPAASYLPARLFWIASHAAVYPETGKHRDYAFPFPVEGRKAVSKVIEFQWEGQTHGLEHGPYKASVEALVTPQRFNRKRWKRLLTVDLHTELWDATRDRLLPRSNDPEYYEAIKRTAS